MSFLDNFSQWNKLDETNQRANLTESNQIIKIIKKPDLHIHLFYQ